jgi:hypothetical protein
MAWIVGDGFDCYGVVGDLARSGVWDAISVTPPALGTAANTRFNMGKSLGGFTSSLGDYFSKNFGNENVVYLNFAIYLDVNLTGTNRYWYMTLRDGGTAQCSILIDSSGVMTLRLGLSTGTVLATYPDAVRRAIWEHFQIKVTVGTAGAVAVRRNGQTTDTFAASGFSTKATANDYANSVLCGWGTGIAGACYIDDVLVFSGSGAAPNTWVGDSRCVVLPAVRTPTPTFTAFPDALANWGATTVSSFINFAANTVYLTAGQKPAQSGVITKVTINPNANASGHFKAALYTADWTNSQPGPLVAVSTNELTSLVAGVTQDFLFPAGTWVSSTRMYWVGLLADVAWVSKGGSDGPDDYWTHQAAVPYASGFPANVSAVMTTTTLPPYAAISMTENAVCVGEEYGNGDTDYVFSSTVAATEMYDTADLHLTPLAIIGAVARVFVKKNDAGARSGRVVAKSGATEVVGTDTALPTTYTYLAVNMPTDPATGTAWTLAGINGVQVGSRVTA